MEQNFQTFNLLTSAILGSATCTDPDYRRDEDSGRIAFCYPLQTVAEALYRLDSGTLTVDASDLIIRYRKYRADMKRRAL